MRIGGSIGQWLVTVRLPNHLDLQYGIKWEQVVEVCHHAINRLISPLHRRAEFIEPE
jgi:hypothetical protein